MKLYYAPGTCALAVHIALREAGVAFDLHRVDIKAKKTADGGDYYAINPKGYVPALSLADDTVLTEVTPLLQFIADENPQAGLLAQYGSQARYRQNEWLAFISTELHKGFGPLWKPATPDEYKVQVKALLATRFDYLQKQLGDRSWLAGDQYSLVDAYLFTILNWGQWVDVDVSAWPRLTEHMERVAARPAVQKALKEEGLLS